MKENLVVLFLGPSGCGKDTQAQMLIEEFGFKQLSAGDFFRKEIAEGDEEGRRLKEYLDTGVLVPNDLWYQVVKKHIKKNISEGRIIFQGVVREVQQKEIIDEILEECGFPLQAVIHFDLSIEDAIERMSLRRSCSKCGKIYHLKFDPPQQAEVCDLDGEKLVQRDDDTGEAIKGRISFYQNNIKPILKYYKDKNILWHIDGGKSIPEVYKQLLNILEKI